MAKTPLWRDIVWNVDFYQSFPFAVYTSLGQELYRGIATESYEGEYSIALRLNDIFSNALSRVREVKVASSGTYIDETHISAENFVVKNLASNATMYYDVVADYSYMQYRAIASDTVNDLVDRRQHLLITYWEDSSFAITKTRISYGSSEYSVISGSGARTYCVGPSDLSNAERLYARGNSETRTWRVQDTCADYVLHYVNTFGGWDSLVMLGRCSVAEDYKRAEIKRNSSKVVYANEVTKKWVLRTGLLTDEQSSKMHHLLGTTRAMLEDLNTGEIVDVVVTNSSCDTQTFRGNGNKMAQYEINVSLAEDRIRR